MINALVLSAGGLWGAWEVGAWKVLRERFQFDMIIGTSAGALNGWAIASGTTPEELEREWLDAKMAGVMQLGLHAAGFLRGEPLHERARELFERGKPRMPFALTMVEIPSLRSRIVREHEITPLHLAASCAIPLGFPPVKIDGHYYIDGGFRAGLPLWAAEELGATQAIRYKIAGEPRSGLAWARHVAPPSPVDTMVPAAPTASHRSALRQATAYNRCRVPPASARHAPDVAAERPVPGAPGLAWPGLPQPASRTAAAHSQVAAAAAGTRRPARTTHASSVAAALAGIDAADVRPTVLRSKPAWPR